MTHPGDVAKMVTRFMFWTPGLVPQLFSGSGFSSHVHLRLKDSEWILKDWQKHGCNLQKFRVEHVGTHLHPAVPNRRFQKGFDRA